MHRSERLITSSAWANLEMHAYYLRLKRGLSGSTLVMYWDTVYTRSTHGLRVTLVRITPEEPPLTQTHSLDSLPAAHAAGAAAAHRPHGSSRRSASPRPRAARLHRDEHGREQLVHERFRLRDHVHTSAHARGRPARGSRASRPQRRRTHLRGHTRVCIRSAQLQQLTTQGNYDADIIIRASSRA